MDFRGEPDSWEKEIGQLSWGFPKLQKRKQKQIERIERIWKTKTDSTFCN